MNPRIKLCLSADQEELDAERVRADEKHGNEEKPERENGFRIIPAKDRPDDRMRENKNKRQEDKRDIDRDQLDPLHEIVSPRLAFVEDLAQAREKRLGKRGERESLAEAREFFGDGVKSRGRVIGEKTDRKDAGGGVGVDRDDRDEDVPACRELSAQTRVAGEPEQDPQFFKGDVLPPKSGDQTHTRSDERDHEIIARAADKK